MTFTRAVVVACVIAMGTVPAEAQSYRLKLDARGQAVSFRGITNDSIARALVVPGANGGLETPWGNAVRCGAGFYCFFQRPGPVLHAVPVTASASLVLWDLGVQGLTAHGTGRVLADLGGNEVWPGTAPSAQLIEGYLEYERSVVTARAGRQVVASRLEPIGFDGGWARARWDDASLDIAAYGGWGLGQAAALPVSSPALNPLDEWRPADRQLVAGLEGSWVSQLFDLRAEYRREIDPEDHYFVSERTAVSVGARAAAIRIFGGFDYNLAEGHAGSADVTLTYLHSRFSVSGGARHYRPYFSLWTLWGAFSPTPYNAINASVELRATEWLSLNARGERYRFEDAGISTGLVPHLEDQGWRASTGGTATMSERWTIDGNYHLEYGPGAAARFADAAVRYTPNDRYAFDLFTGSLARPLELRNYHARSRWFGGRAEWAQDTQRRIWSDVSFIDEARQREDASGLSRKQVHLRAGMSVAFGSGADRMPLPPGRRPER